MKVLITGAAGFIGKNLRQVLAPRKDVEVFCFTEENSLQELPEKLQGVDFIFHLAGVNRTKNPEDFTRGNVDFSTALVQAIGNEAKCSGKKISLIYTSSTQAALDNIYGRSKLAAEKVLRDGALNFDFPLYIFRLPNVFGKWCKPNYNSAVATFCYNITHSLPIHINDAKAPLNLVYVDDVVECFVRLMDGNAAVFDANSFAQVTPQYLTTVGEVASLLEEFKASRDNLLVGSVGTGFVRALYATYVSYLSPESFNYSVPTHSDSRGTFVEMLKTANSGQFSYFTAHPGITRGGHYHHTKTEKFMVIHGTAKFRFRQVQTNEYYEITVSGEKPQIVETVPGWAHDVTNIGKDEMIVLLWANEVFDKEHPDTFAYGL